MISNISFELSSIFTVFLVISLCFSSCSCIRTRDLRRNAEFIDHTAISRPQPRVDHARMMAEFANHTAISDFRIINRKSLGDCPDPNPYIRINVSSANAKLSDDQFVTVTISGVLVPAASDWVAMISPANSDVSSCPLNGIQYQQTGDFSILPLLCHYPAQYASSDPGYLACKNQECQQRNARGDCVVKTCSATLQFHVINIRTDIEFVFFAGGFITPCILKRTTPTSFANPKKPLYGHLSSIDSTGNSMRVTWVSGDKTPQKVQYGNGKSQTSVVTTFSQADMCSSLSVVNAIASEVSSGNIDSIFHIGDISYATGFLVEWDFFLHLISPVAAQLSYMTAIGNHERDYIDTGSVYVTADSGGECGVPYETYFPMPTSEKDKPWYSIEQGSVHFTVISTEHDWSESSEQFAWMKKDMASVDRTRTPWLIFMGHRPMYSTSDGSSFIPSVDNNFVQAVEPLLLSNKVDLALFGHVHNYERTCAVYQGECKAMPTKDGNGIDTYDNTNYQAPVHAVIGMAGFSLDSFPSTAKFGYARVHATRTDLNFEFVNANTTEVGDRFHITRS
uniref:Purple acid phosphatase n=1 Tax=Daucus carota subsp. sativus TaxID=79200 RepID=A0A164VFR4_DAUCS